MQLQAFAFGPHLSLRVVDIDGAPWFVAKDACDALGYARARKAVSDHVHDEDVITAPIRSGNRGNPNTKLLNESGLYALIFGSELESAREFKRWVTREVLPAIRKRGAYMTQDTAQRVINDAQEGVRIAHEQLAETRRLNGDLKREPRHPEHPTEPRTAGASSFLDPTCPHAFSRPGSMSARPSR